MDKPECTTCLANKDAYHKDFCPFGKAAPMGLLRCSIIGAIEGTLSQRFIDFQSKGYKPDEYLDRITTILAQYEQISKCNCEKQEIPVYDTTELLQIPRRT